MMQKYLETKEQYKDCVLFYRLGDFYELFFDDAVNCSRILGLTLTGKNCGLPERAPMCGVPFHAVDSYIDKLVKNGMKVAICEQVEDPKLAKGLVKREVIRIATPGTVISMQSLDESRNNFLMCIVYMANDIGVSYADVSTGDFFVTHLADISLLKDEILKTSPSEIICNESFFVSGFDIDFLKDDLKIAISSLPDSSFDDEYCRDVLLSHFRADSLDSLGLKENSVDVSAAGACLKYLLDTQKISLDHITAIKPIRVSDFMILDHTARRNLELTETMLEKEKRGSLFWVLDKTKTAMGARKLRSSIEEPLIDKDAINHRLDAIEALNADEMMTGEIRGLLNSVYDLERLITKISYKSANPKDLLALKTSLEVLPDVKRDLENFNSDLLKEIHDNIDEMQDAAGLIDKSIDPSAPVLIHEGGIIKEGYNDDVDHLRKAKTEGKKWLADLLDEEKKRSGIKGLKLKYNKVFGYYLEVTNSYRELVPEDWTRKQTLVNAERYTTPKLKELEETILGSVDRLYTLEADIYNEILDVIYSNISRIQKTAGFIAYLDMLASLSVVSVRNGYARPKINNAGVINIKNGRHPVVEKMIDNGQFVANDTFLDNKDSRVSIITGPNMAGKSTYMRQTAIIVIMAQIGSFVPAESADIGIVDRIFTRVGASDDLAGGKSTFMVEMSEVANILNNATRNSLVILDEIGRGTSTFDGLSIAWAVVEYIADKRYIGAKTLFATHYHELTELEGKIPGVHNYCIAVKEQGEDIIFLRKIVKGGADKSYGIQVARLAGIPDNVLNRARELVNELSDNDLLEKAKEIASLGKGRAHPGAGLVSASEQTGIKASHAEADIANRQISLFDKQFADYDDIISELLNLDLNTMTPMSALNKLFELQKSAKDKI
ncbi:MAG: DNA mismatch repair protein MutS [Lachnospiraceae bacterium]|nr:DNA mismatch repair protein MutS [Lachnospiraceae bacterium]MEE3461609.1 DNA mismatch repair protein MutS [Lachnospiraceae bacterium]